LSPIPKAPNIQKSPVAKAIEEIQRAQMTGHMPRPTGVIVHPSAMEEIKKLIAEQGTVVPPTGGPLMRAASLMGVPVNTLPPHQMAKAYSKTELEAMMKTQLEVDLENSLWALAKQATPVFTQEDLARHLGPGHLVGETVIKRVFDKHVMVLCPCNMMLEMNHCQGPAFAREGTARCQNFVVGGTVCGECRGLRCSYVVLTADTTYDCTNLAVMQQEDGRYMCADEEHRT
jgi:hypothetical protein